MGDGCECIFDVSKELNAWLEHYRIIKFFLRRLEFERFDEYSKILGPIINLYGEMLIDGSQRLPDVVKDVMLKRFFAPSILLASEELGDLLIEYKDKESFRKALLSVKNVSFCRRDILESYKKCFSFNAGVQKVSNILNDFR